MRDPCRTRVLTPGGPKPHHLPIVAEYGKAPSVCLPLRYDRLTSAVPGITLVRFPLGGGLIPLGGPPPRSLLLAPLASDLTRFCLRHQSQQMVPAKPDPTVASTAGLLVSAVREAALAAIPVPDHLLPLGNRQTLESLAFIQGVSR